jgi:hypothetical protein
MSELAPITERELELLAKDVRLHVLREAANTGHVPQAPAIAAALGRTNDEILAALNALAVGRTFILAPGNTNIWTANPFCAVPSSFRVDAKGKRYWGICIWDSLGIPAALDADAVISATCGDCGAPMSLEVRDRKLVHSEGVVHFGVPAHRWWENIGFT